MMVAQMANSQGVKGPWNASACAKASTDARSQGMKVAVESLGEVIVLLLLGL